MFSSLRSNARLQSSLNSTCFLSETSPSHLIDRPRSIPTDIMFVSVHLAAILSAACLPLGTLAMPHVEARAGSVCSSGIYGELAPVLAGYSAAQSYCTSKYPVPCTTVMFTKVKRSPAKTTSTKSSAVSTKTKASTTSAPNAQASALSVLQQQVASAVSTLCSCIETPTVSTHAHHH